MMKRLTASFALFSSVLIMPVRAVLAWNILGHMLSGGIAYQILQRENPSIITTIRSVLENNPWYETRCKAQLGKTARFRNAMKCCSCSAARWADDIRTRDPPESHRQWHYMDFPFNPEGEPASADRPDDPAERACTGGQSFLTRTNPFSVVTRYFALLAA